MKHDGVKELQIHFLVEIGGEQLDASLAAKTIKHAPKDSGYATRRDQNSLTENQDLRIRSRNLLCGGIRSSPLSTRPAESEWGGLDATFHPPGE
jgi:hypothetical protein